MKVVRFILLVCAMVCMAEHAEAYGNDFLEQENHYSVYAKGVDVIHFKLPVYSRGTYNYFVGSDDASPTYLYYMLNDTEYPICCLKADRYGNNSKDDVTYGTVSVQAKNRGIVEITNIYNGTRAVVPEDNAYHTYNVTKTKEVDNGKDYVTWLEIDWYPPVWLDTLTFTLRGDIMIWQSSANEIYYRRYLNFGSFTGAGLMTSPQLYDPIFYSSKETDISGYGCAAVPYVVYHDLTSYHTSFDARTYRTNKRADNIYVPTTDTVQPGFKAIFNVYRRKEPRVEMVEQTTNAVTIPAYHRIYDFAVEEELDEYETFTGNNVLTWRVKNPDVPDLVEGDYFEVQRALKSDFSDARTIDVVSMERGADKAEYKVVDNSRESWSGNAEVRQDTLSTIYTHEVKGYMLYDAEGNPMCEVDFIAKATDVQLPSVPVYYRVRRASASMWGWRGHEFAREQKCRKHNFLAPLALTQSPYTLDAESHTVDFRIVLENREVSAMTILADSLQFTHIATRGHRTDDNRIRYVTFTGDGKPIEDMIGEVTAQWYEPGMGNRSERITEGFTIALHPGYEIYLIARANGLYQSKWIKNDPEDSENNLDMRVLIREELNSRYNVYALKMYEDVGPFNRDEQARFAALSAHLADSLARVMVDDLSGTIGRCMWDRSARLVLEKTMNGVTQHIIIPQDSIRRLPDGNWEAHVVDAADHACTHYSYAVRIDQSDADLHVADSAYLLPVALYGPNLYFDEGASIRTFTASNLDAKEKNKRGIMLRWEPTTAAVDNYILLRRTGDDTKADTVYTGLDNSFFDMGVSPEHTYRYTIKAVYDCNGQHSEHYAEATGRRSPYGEIRGQIQMPDNSGMAGVTVALQDGAGAIIRSAVTKADGRFAFDSLTYNMATGTDFVVIPTAQYGTFSFNHTSAGSAILHLSVDDCIAEDVTFANTATTRLTGRALFQGSTIPVAGAMFVLNGDTLRRNQAPLLTDVDGTFELTLTTGQPYTLQIVKPGHTFEGDGILHVEQERDTFALTGPLDGVRFYDLTKVRLVGRVAGGNIQRDLPAAFGLGKNNLGDDLQLVLQLEGDNTAMFVHDPNDLTRDTVQQTVEHQVFTTDPLSVVPYRTVGSTHMLMQKKRIIIHPDVATGEFAVDLYPVKYKVVQASANGYATLFAPGQGSETFDLTNAPLADFSPKHGTDSVHYNAVYNRIYHSPVQIHLKQLLYGLPQDGFGEAEMKVSSFNMRSNEQVALYTRHEDGTVTYTLDYPVFYYNRKYQFEAQAYEDYYYNNDRDAGAPDRVPQSGGTITIHNGMESATTHVSYPLDSVGKNRNIYLNVSHIETELHGPSALHTVSTALTIEGNTVETEAFRAFIAGDVVLANELRSTDAAITVLDIIRDPGGNGSSAWIESGASYTYSYSQSYDFNLGVELTPTWGVNINSQIGAITGAPGTYNGSSFSTSKEFSISVPISHEIAWSNQYTYNLTTNTKITTSAVKSKQGIGANADVFLGVKTSVLAGKAKSISIINDTLFRQRQPAIQSGAMHVLAQGVDTTGRTYYLVTGEKIVLGSQVDNTFAYTQHHILNSVLPRIFTERDNLLEYFADSLTAQQAADRRGEEVYWYIDSLTAEQLQQPLLKDRYKMITPSNDHRVYVDRVGAMENTVKHWIAVLSKNEEEKIKARYSGKQLGVYSVSAGTSYTHNETYATTFNYSQKPKAMAFGSNAAANAGQFASSYLKNAANLKLFGSLGKASQQVIQSATKLLQSLTSKDGGNGGKDVETTIVSKSAGSTFSMDITPIIDIDMNFREGQEITNKKTAGFTIMPDKQGELTVLDNLGEITVAVYRADIDSVWAETAAPVTEQLNTPVAEEHKYGSYVFFTQSGSTYCMFEDEDTTLMFNPGTTLNNPTLMLAKPEMSINTYEQANVLPDQRAVFKLELRNAGEIPYGWYNGGVYFTLSLYNNSNPDGAKLYVNGVAIAQGVEYYLEPGQSVVQTLEVERGDVDDYENLQLCFQVSDCPKNWAFLDFSVHFIPLSCDVQIDMPNRNWVMNTLSQKDSTGYYLPVEISGFDTHHKNFDHIEFQYKLSKESEDMWVTAMSFYADDSLYNLATGNKAMIQNGRIIPFRFYGERDPIEQEYDLRAVSFCRYGSGYVHKASPVISGVKDTRRPELFGDPEPVNSILGVGEHLKLRFTEPIAGNYLDEDNNFSLQGVTNKTGITAGTSLHFDGSETSYAVTKTERNLAEKSVSIDLLVKPADSNREEIFFSHGSGDNVTRFGLTADRRLFVSSTHSTVYSKPLEALLEFTRVTMVYDYEANSVRFFAGTEEMTEPAQYRQTSEPLFYNAPLVFGKGFSGNMLEARVWSKALTPEEIAATNMRRLSGYERGLTAYYLMNEGRGETCNDKANGATLYLHNTTWMLQKGISMALNGDSLQLAAERMSRSDVYDETFMLWFKTASKNAPVFRAGWTANDTIKSGSWLGMEEGLLTMYSDSNVVVLFAVASDNEWHHFALSVNRSYNTASFFLDGKLIQNVPATEVRSLRGAMFLGGKNFVGNVDELTIYEQALPRSLIEERYNMAPAGDEMGLMAYLPFSEQILNPNGVLELIYSPNDQRTITGAEGKTTTKAVPLVLTPDAARMADKSDFAPVRDHGLLNKLKYSWAFNTDELLINLKMQDYEINKQTVYVTVRDVEDLHGNAMASPVTWAAFVDRNTLKWEKRDVYYTVNYQEQGISTANYQLAITNVSGRTHQYTIDNMPDWLTIEPASGTLSALEEKTVELQLTRDLAPGKYTETLYLTDENDLAEPLNIHLTVVANPPYEDIDAEQYPYTMSICAKVLISDETSLRAAEKEDIVYALFNHEPVGMAHVTFNELSNASELYLTVYGKTKMKNKPVSFQLWQASTGKSLSLYCNQDIRFAHGAVYGCDDTPVYLTTTGTQMLSIPMPAGWSWISTNLDMSPTQGDISACVSAALQQKEGDLIKNPVTRQFAVYSEEAGQYNGTLSSIHHSQMYIVFTSHDNMLRIEGDRLPDDSMHITLRGDGSWNALPCLLNEATTLTEAMADYYDHATAGDIIKSHDRFAVFTSDGKWQGNLTALRPGEGYLMRRMAADEVTVRFYSRNAAGRSNSADAGTKNAALKMENLFRNPKAATNMTMVATIASGELPHEPGEVRAYIGNEQVAAAAMSDSLCFLTIQTDASGLLRFETAEGEVLHAVYPVRYAPDTHIGTPQAPVVLIPGKQDCAVSKLIENDRVIIVRDGVRYDIIGVQLK